MIRPPLWATAVFASVCTLAAGCAPVTVADCAVSELHGRNVRVTVEIRNGSSKSISAFDALLWTPKSLTGYTFHVPVEPWQTRRISAWQAVEKDAGDPKDRVGPVTQCTLHTIEYSDGTAWRGPSPL